jgi:His-Xaa-Ser system radical SAM maturase HxsC
MSSSSTAPISRVVDLDALGAQWRPDLHFAVLLGDDSRRVEVEALIGRGLSNIGTVHSEELETGDVIARLDGKSEVAVVYRPSDVHHALLLTNRCNSNCLMCSQPPTKDLDEWRVAECLEVIRHIESSPPVLGLTGGEPLLLGSGLVRILDAVRRVHEPTWIEVLTNGRLLSNDTVVDQIIGSNLTHVAWLVPLYGHADFVHDFVVQAPGAFDETIAGLLALHEHGQPIQLRIVLIEPVLQVLPALSAFIGRNLPFVHVAIMGCEPTGFALANRAVCEVNLSEWTSVIRDACKTLDRHRVPYNLMNIPLCALPRELRSRASKSISDWKNVYVPECGRCTVRNECCGLFAWHSTGWRPCTIKAIEESLT